MSQEQKPEVSKKRALPRWLIPSLLALLLVFFLVMGRYLGHSYGEIIIFYFISMLGFALAYFMR
jgi:hypothetical protein